MAIGVVTGMPRETGCFRVLPAGERPAIRCLGMGPDKARRAAAELVAEGVEGLVSFGTAGGLVAAFEAGTVVFADAVVAPDGRRLPTSRPWLDLVRARVGGEWDWVVGAVAGSDVLVPGGAAKAWLRAASGAVAVDMESHAVAEVAAAAGLPFLVMRAVADSCELEVPAWIGALPDAAGEVAVFKALGAVLAHPADWAAVLRLQRGSRAALASLRMMVAAAGPRLAAPRPGDRP